MPMPIWIEAPGAVRWTDRLDSEHSVHHMSLMWNGFSARIKLTLPLDLIIQFHFSMQFSVQQTVGKTVDYLGITDKPADRVWQS